MRAPNVLTISPALPFIDTFVAALLRGDVVPAIAISDDPLALAAATIYVPTRRAKQALADAILKHAGRTSVALPRILPLGSLEATETAMIFAEPDLAGSGLPLPPAASPIWRRLRLATLIQQWATSLRGALCSVDASGTRIVDPNEAFRVATSSVDAFALAGDLAGLIDELLIEDVAWRALDDLEMAAFDDYWRITTDFLSIAIDLWPQILAENGRVDPASRQIALIEAQTLALGEAASGPVIAIGSTGTNKATARLLAAIARAPQGAVVLPGLDTDLDEASWALIAGRIGEGQEPSFGHPQAAMARLLPILDIGRADVRALGVAEPKATARARFVAEAMRPADTTDLWRDYRRAVPRKAIAAALTDVALIEAADEREEALCLAVALREILETPGRTGALVTPDRELARRVRGELLRWSIEISDTGGEPLASRPLGILARLVAAAAGTRSARDLGALLAHPLAVFGRDRADVARLASLIDIGLLRCVALDGSDPGALFSAARTAATDRHAHAAQREIEAHDWGLMEALWHDIDAALAPLQAIEGEQTIGVWAAAHATAVASVAAAGATDEVEALEALFEELTSPAATLRVESEDYEIFFGRLAGEATLRNTDRPHPRLRIYGLLEARLVQADVMLLAGLDETIWPPQATSDPFLNRPMRRDLGLSPPERRIGQTAHDFTMAMGHGTIILSRARKRGGSPCVPSRFLLRLEALAGKAWDGCRERGRRIVKLAHLLDDPGKAPVAIGRPRPTPPIELRPVRLSVTQIETLRRDPYSIYAGHILKLAPLPQLGTELDAGTFGEMIHAILHRFSDSEAARGSHPARRAALRGFARDAFDKALADPVFDAFRWPVILKTIDTFLSFDAAQRETAASIRVETTGTLSMTLADQSSFRLTARADRIDVHRDGSATLIDYKTGQPPGRSEVQVGFAPQLTLEAAILRGGGFGHAHDGDIAATYLKLGGRDGGFVRKMEFDDELFADVATRHFEGLHRLLSSFRDIKTAYPSRPFPKYAKKYGDFDHLARVREWSLAGDDEVTP